MRIAARGASTSTYPMQQLALGSLSEQYFVDLGAMLSAYGGGRIGEPARSFFRRGRRDGFPIYRVLLDARATNSSTFESKSLRMGDWFDFL